MTKQKKKIIQMESNLDVKKINLKKIINKKKNSLKMSEI